MDGSPDSTSPEPTPEELDATVRQLADRTIAHACLYASRKQLGVLRDDLKRQQTAMKESHAEASLAFARCEIELQLLRVHQELRQKEITFQHAALGSLDQKIQRLDTLLSKPS